MHFHEAFFATDRGHVLSTYVLLRWYLAVQINFSFHQFVKFPTVLLCRCFQPVVHGRHCRWSMAWVPILLKSLISNLEEISADLSTETILQQWSRVFHIYRYIDCTQLYIVKSRQLQQPKSWYKDVLISGKMFSADQASTTIQEACQLSHCLAKFKLNEGNDCLYNQNICPTSLSKVLLILAVFPLSELQGQFTVLIGPFQERFQEPTEYLPQGRYLNQSSNLLVGTRSGLVVVFQPGDVFSHDTDQFNTQDLL